MVNASATSAFQESRADTNNIFFAKAEKAKAPGAGRDCDEYGM